MRSLEAPRLGVVRPLAIALAACTAGCVNIAAQYEGVIDRVERRFETTDAPVINLETFDGRISVATWNRSEVLVVVEKHLHDKDETDLIQVSANQVGNRIDVAVRAVGPRRVGFRSGPFTARLLVVAPQRASLTASSGDGRVDVVDLEGDVDVRTGDGAIQIADVSGSVRAQSGDGSIAIEGRLREVRARSGDGSVKVRAHDGSSASAAWSIATGDGAVVLELPDAFDAELDAHTGDGRISVTDVAFAQQSKATERRAVQGRIGAGGHELQVRTGDGSITVRGVSR